MRKRTHICAALFVTVLLLVLPDMNAWSGTKHENDTTFSLPTLTTKSLPDGICGEPYQQTITVTGGIAPYIFFIEKKQLYTRLRVNEPYTVSIDKNGGVQVTKKTSAASQDAPYKLEFTVGVTDNAGVTVKKAYSVTMQPVPRYDFTMQATIGGEVHSFLYEKQYEAGETVTLTATTQAGYAFVKWEAVSPSTLLINDGQFKMPKENVTVKAVYEKNN